VAGPRVAVLDRNRWYRDTRGRARSEPPRTGADGRYETVGLPPGQANSVDITADRASLGATVDAVAEPDGGTPKTIEVQLQPLVSLSGRVLDTEDHPTHRGQRRNDLLHAALVQLQVGGSDTG
jgi:hypothetical protein